ncbi:MAG TPA: sigma-70 family RNA polymerase sigma factor [Candidatus Limnocylindrales bacterium]|nr:sigma-70 family RNA polymerase sigma factor [Candidatus Limnocylindrales bacterium]
MSAAAGDQASLVLRARDGDAGAFEELATREQSALFRHVLRLLPDHADAEDVVQDALVSAWRAIGAFEGTSFRAWLFRIATNRAIDVIRARRRRAELPLDPPAEDDDSPGWAEPAAPGSDLADIAGDREAVRAVEELLGRVPVEQRAALLLRDVEGFSYEEIAVITAVEVGTVKSRIHRARLSVRNGLVARGWRGTFG